QTEYVRAFIHQVNFTTGLLGRHVRQRAHHRARLRRSDERIEKHSAKRSGLRLWKLRSLPGPPDLRQAPVHDLHFPERSHHDVGGLQVTMNHAPRVSKSQGMTNLSEYRQVGLKAVIGVLSFGK